MQDRLDAAATQLLGAGGAGNASIVAAPQTRKLQVYWHGRVPARVRALVRRLDVTVVFHPAAFTFRALVDEARRLAAAPGVAAVSPKPDGSGLAVTVTSRAVAGQRLALAASRIPLTVTIGPRPQAFAGRQADVAPYDGGSRYSTPAGACTNGFALDVGSPPNVDEISAGHCGTDDQAVTIPGHTASVGTILNQNACRDTLWINYPAGVDGRIFTGAFDAKTTAAVASATSDFVGNLVVTGGASSGEHRDITVQAVDVFAQAEGTDCTEIGPLTRAGYKDARCAVAPGDSGGPVYTYTGSGAVVGRGTITGGTTTVTAKCPGVSPNGSNTVWYAPLLRPDGDPQIGSLQFYNVALLTG
jgi:hypothetical protein